MRQHSGDNTAHFFDWLATPAEGLLHLIENGFPTFEAGKLSLVRHDDPNGFVADAVTRIHFHHQFPRRGRLLRADFLESYATFAAKFEFLAERFRETARAHPVCFVRRRISHTMALRLEVLMRRLFPDTDMRFLYVIDAGPSFETPLGRAVLFNARNSAFGDSLAWARLLEAEGLVTRPFRLASPQIVRSSADDNHIGERKTQPARMLAEARRVNPENPWFDYELGMHELARWRFRHAAGLARAALRRDPTNVDFIELRLRAERGPFQRASHAALAEALSLLDRAVDSGLWELAADLLISQRRFDEALELIRRGLAIWGDAHGLHSSRALAHFRAGRVIEADAAIDAALALSPMSRSLVEMKANVLCALGRQDEAFDLVQSVLRAKRSRRLQVVRARLAIQLGPRDAVARIRSAVRLNTAKRAAGREIKSQG